MALKFSGAAHPVAAAFPMLVGEELSDLADDIEKHGLHQPRVMRDGVLIDGTSAARETFLASFLDEVDPHHELPDEERRRRSDHARKAHFSRLSFLALKARREVEQ